MATRMRGRPVRWLLRANGPEMAQTTRATVPKIGIAARFWPLTCVNVVERATGIEPA
jgi:hypothetical protein